LENKKPVLKLKGKIMSDKECSSKKRVTFEEDCKGMAGLKQKCQVISGLNQEICKEISERHTEEALSAYAFIAVRDSARFGKQPSACAA
jgi:hypothetical protein